MDQEIASLAVMREINGNSYSLYDHAFYVIGGLELSLDSIRAVSALLAPDFSIFDDTVLNVSAGAVDKFKELRTSGKSKDEAQYWANMLPIGDLLTYVHDKEEKSAIAVFIEENWSRLLQRFVNSCAVTRIIDGDDADEIYITVSVAI